MEGLPTLELKLDPNGVSAPAIRTVGLTVHVVATCLRAVAADDLSPPDMHSEFMGYNSKHRTFRWKSGENSSRTGF